MSNASSEAGWRWSAASSCYRHLDEVFVFQFLKGSSTEKALADAISRSQAVIEFGTDGTILTANDNFLKALGYTLGEIRGKHHSMFVDPSERDSASYREFWAALRRGEYQAAEYKRIGKGGREVWIQATYNPVLDAGGKPVKVVKFATDITARKIKSMEDASQIAAISRAQAVIAFEMDGTIVSANENFLKALGYTLAEIKGKHHGMFVEQAMRDSAAYREFWARLNRGEHQSAEYKRIGKGGREVWILASYNPVFDDKGKPFRVVKFATDVTSQKLATADLAGQIAAISKAQAVIEFNMDGTIIGANQNFLNALGYALDEIRGRHHSMFVDPSERDSAAYREFWAALNRGEYQAAEYKRLGKGAKEVWIQASYNPILDLNGKPFKVVKYATDTTAQVLVRLGNERVRGMMESVASGAEELNASVREISEAMTKSRETASTAVGRVEAADAQAKRLNEAAQAMSGIVELIGNITGQINLLALNATIESARAGEAGRGFAVVASEVKNLATQAKQATDKIGQEIGNLNNISGDVVGALDSIKQAIQGVSEYVTATAAAVEEQSTVTGEMSSSMQRAAAEAKAIAQR
ncbi:PAS domain-containing protein [Bradyrhizobium sp. CSA112]|nr:PAS domain-containing protein [Bradyrhizobium sp. CSA112]